MNDPTQFEQVDETCEFGGAVLYSESLGITAFFENAVPSKYETHKLKQLQWCRQDLDLLTKAKKLLKPTVVPAG